MEHSNEVSAWAVHKGGEELREVKVSIPELLDDQVEVKIKACGVCYSDVMIIKGEADASGMYKYPTVCGHEGVGVVARAGQLVKNVKVGDLVGIGVFRDRCSQCEFCADGKDNLCAKKKLTFAGGATGCFGEFVRINSNFAFPIPQGLSAEHAAPLMCAGLTTFAPFRVHDIRPGQAVGVVGIGGLGHLSLQFARAFGCTVTAFSSSPSKEAEASGFGAHHFAAPDNWGKFANTQDYIMVTASSDKFDWKSLVAALRPGGKMILMGGISFGGIPVSTAELIMGQKSIIGSAAGSSGTAIAMLKFAALHKIKPAIQLFKFSEINEVIAKVAKNDVKYRAVLLRN